jgi:hypothetical protein
VSYLININRFSGSGNMGGILNIQVARAADVESIPFPVAGVVYGDIVMKAGKSFVTWKVTQETIEANSKGKTTREGFGKDNSLPFNIPKDRSDIREMLDHASEDELIVLYQDANGKQKIFGLIGQPVQFEYDHNSGGKWSDFNNYDCRFYYTGPENMFEYNGTLPTPPTSAAPSIVKWNGVAIASLNAGEQINFVSEFGYTEFFITS